MKKTIKSSVVAIIMVILLLSLTGCGGDKIVVTNEEDDIKMEISFKDDVADKVKITAEAPSKEIAKESVEYFKERYGEDAKIKVSGKKVIIETNAKDVFKSSVINNINEKNLTKENITKSLEASGFEVKD